MLFAQPCSHLGQHLGARLGEAVRWRGTISDTRRAGDYYRIVDDDRLLWGGRITTDTREPPRLRAGTRNTHRRADA